MRSHEVQKVWIVVYKVMFASGSSLAHMTLHYKLSQLYQSMDSFPFNVM